MARREHAPPWLFGVTCIPYGVAGGFTSYAMPFLLRKAGISIGDIGWFSTATFIPSVLQFLYAPVIDIGPRRRTWLVLLSALGAACFCGALLVPLPSGAPLFLVLAVAGQWLVGLVGSCNGGLMSTTLPDGVRGRAGGFYNAGNLSGGAIGAGVTMTCARLSSPAVVGLVTAAMIVLPSLAAFAIDEPPRPPRRAAEIFIGMIRDVARTARSRPGWTGILFCVLPAGTAAIQFSALGVDYGVRDAVVEQLGYYTGFVTAAGALGAGWLCDRVSRRGAYLLSGILSAACATATALSPLVPSTYVAGVLVYQLIAGLCYAAFSALVLEAMGPGGPSAATKYTLFTSAGNLAIMYTGLFDTRFATPRLGARGVLLADAAANVVGVVVLLILFTILGRGGAGALGAPPRGARKPPVGTNAGSVVEEQEGERE